MIERRRVSFHLALVVAIGLVDVPSARAQSGTALTPDRRIFLVNKDLGAERWTISAGLATGDLDSVVSITGNVFRSDGGTPSFVLCQIRQDSTGTLQDPESLFRLTCRGTDACATTARECARDRWVPIADAVEIPAGFFLPPGGVGTLAADRADGAPAAAARWLDEAVSWVGEALGLTAERTAQAPDRGATLSLDRLTHLVNKDVGDQRWSIGLNFAPVRTEAGGVTRELRSVTGNVFFPDGSPPSFVYCTVREDSTGTLEDTASELRFRCAGASACGGTAADCAASAWTPIADDVRLPASFFLPPGGLPPSVQSDPDVFVIGRTSDPPSIVSREFTLPGADGVARTAGVDACPAGATCLADRIGSCTGVAGTAIDIDGFGCGCSVADVPAECITCGGGATGACGGAGGYPVGNSGRMARGVCLPFSAARGDCVVYAVRAGGTEDTVVESCGGPLGASCAGDRCCADDPRDGCDVADGGTGCAGICVSASACDPSSESCGTCFAEPGPGPECGDGVRDPGEQCDGADLRGETCGSLGLGEDGELACDDDCNFDSRGCGGAPTCGNGVREENEACDGDDLGGETCSSLTGGAFPTGELTCTSSCALDVSDCNRSSLPDCFVSTVCSCTERDYGSGYKTCVVGASVSPDCPNPVRVDMTIADCPLSTTFVLSPDETDSTVNNRCALAASPDSTLEVEAVDEESGASGAYVGECGVELVAIE